MYRTSKHNYSITIPCFTEFQEAGKLTLFVYDFHQFFDGLLGLDLLTRWESNIDLDYCLLLFLRFQRERTCSRA
jgi:hypothetical protein